MHAAAQARRQSGPGAPRNARRWVHDEFSGRPSDL